MNGGQDPRAHAGNGDPAWPPPAPPPPGPSRRVAATVVIVTVVLLLAAAALTAWRAFAPTGQAPTTPPSLSVSPKPSPPATTTTVDAAAIGAPVELKTSNGTATASITGARWTNAGVDRPFPGHELLILDVEVRVTAGAVRTGPAYLRVLDAAGTAHGWALGGDPDQALKSGQLRAHQVAKGTVSFELPRGKVSVQFLDDALRPLATVEIR